MYAHGRIIISTSIFMLTMAKRHYEVAVAVLVTLVAVFGFLWFSGVEDDGLSDAVEETLPASLQALGAGQ